MTTFLFIVSNLAALALGWLVGKTGRNAAVVAAAIEEGAEAEEGGRAKARPFQWLAVAVVVVSAVTALNGVMVASQQQELVEDQQTFTACVTDQFDLLIEALEARSGSAREATAQQVAVFRTVAEAWRNPTANSSLRVREAIEEYIRLRDDADAALRQNPYPEPPRNACSE